MKKILISMLGISLSCALQANVYFFSPEGQGEQDGTSWDNAASGVDYLGQTITSAAIGDTIYLMEGSYTPDPVTKYWDIPEGVVIKGGYPSSMTGTDTNYDFSLGGQSIFSADLDGDGIGDNTNYCFVYMGKSDVGSKDQFYYKDWKLTEIWGITFRDGVRRGGKYGGNMVFLKHVQADFHFCQFINNVAYEVENGAITMWGCALRCFDCVFKDNYTGNGGGGALCLRARNSVCEEGLQPSEYMVTLVERCCFEDNMAFSPETQEYSNYGGAIYMADYSGTAYFVNSTIKGSRGWDHGAAIRVSTQCTFYSISSTWVDNPCTGVAGGASGSSCGETLSSGDRSKCYFLNSIVVNAAFDDPYNPNRAVIEFTNNDSKAYSKGYGIFGTIKDNGGNLVSWPNTDHLTTSASTVNSTESIFGEGRLSKLFVNHGGFSKTIVPVSQMAASTSVADLQAAVDAWDIDEMAKVMDLTKDQRGYTRSANATQIGAYDVNATSPVSALPSVKGDKVRCHKGMEKGQFFIEKEGVRYNMLGAQL